MKKLLIRLALWILNRWSVQPVLFKPGTKLYCQGYLYEIQTITQSFEYACSSTLKIEAEERIPMEVKVG